MKKTKIIKPTVICSICNSKMNIKVWMSPGMPGFELLPKDMAIPHMNRGHSCICGKYWMSTDDFRYDNYVLIWEKGKW